MNRFDRYRALLEEPERPDGGGADAELLRPLEDLARALRGAGVDAEVIAARSGRRFHLTVSPLHRPAFRSVMLTVAMSNGRAYVNGSTPLEFASAEELSDHLEGFLRLPAFQASLSELRAVAREPVEARLERVNGMGTVVLIPPEEQARLASLEAGAVYSLEAQLLDGEREPDPKSWTLLNAAGIHLTVKDAECEGRTVTLKLLREGAGPG